MDKLNKHLLNLILIRIPLASVFRFMMVKPNIHNNTQFWRVIFFRLAKMPIRSWYDACQIFASQKNYWHVKCYQCGQYIVECLGVPTKCVKCGSELRHQDTQHYL